MSNLAKIARPYAKAVFEIALDEKAIQNWMETLEILTAAVETPELAKIIKDPRAEPYQLGDILIALGKKTFSKTQTNFVQRLAENKRLELLPEITKQFAKMRAAMEKTVAAKVTSAVPLSEEYEKQLIEALSKKLNCQIFLDATVNPSLLGGIIIQIGDKVFDASLHEQLKRIRSSLLA
jgi:F-type H+-transporting ATPase subunit delta